MILLEVSNRIVADTLRLKVKNFAEGNKAEAIDVNLADFDGVMYSIRSAVDKETGKEVKTKIVVSIALK